MSESDANWDWSGSDPTQGTAAVSGTMATGGAAGTAYLTDEEILGIEPPSPNVSPNPSVIPSGARNLSGDFANGTESPQRDSSGTTRPRNDNDVDMAGAEARPGATKGSDGTMPSWMAAAAADPRHGGEAAALWREHQEFRAAFASPEEARAVADETRAIKELLPGGVRDIVSLREATQSVERIDAALFSGDARAQAEVVAELARTNPAAFRSLFAEAAKFMAASPAKSGVIPSEARNRSANVAGAEENLQRDSSGENRPRNDNPGGEVARSEAPVNRPAFDPAAYTSFERATNDAVARDVRGAIGETLARVMPEGVAEGAARRIGEDIFNEVHRALAADRSLSEQVAAVLRDPAGSARSGGWRLGVAEQQRVASLLAGRAKQMLPSVARRVIGEWTSTVLNTARTKAARQAAAASRVDIAAPGGSLDSMPLRQMSPREVDYASMSDEQILGI